MDLEEFKKFRAQAYIDQKNAFLPIIKDLHDRGEWEQFSIQVQCVYEVMPEAFKDYYADMPAEYRRDFVVGCYSHHGDSLPECRKALRKLPKNGKNELPEEYRDKPFITVYRAGEEPIEKAKYRISWTLDPDTARFFFSKWRGRHAAAIYKAKIRPEDVTAYSNEREEYEVMQYGKVYDVELYEV